MTDLALTSARDTISPLKTGRLSFYKLDVLYEPAIYSWWSAETCKEAVRKINYIHAAESFLGAKTILSPSATLVTCVLRIS